MTGKSPAPAAIDELAAVIASSRFREHRVYRAPALGRMLAAFFDAIAISFLLTGITYQLWHTTRLQWEVAQIICVMVVVPAYALFGLLRGISPGKWICDMIVTDNEGSPATRQSHILRFLIWIALVVTPAVARPAYLLAHKPGIDPVISKYLNAVLIVLAGLCVIFALGWLIGIVLYQRSLGDLVTDTSVYFHADLIDRDRRKKGFAIAAYEQGLSDRD